MSIPPELLAISPDLREATKLTNKLWPRVSRVLDGSQSPEVEATVFAALMATWLNLTLDKEDHPKAQEFIATMTRELIEMYETFDKIKTEETIQ